MDMTIPYEERITSYSLEELNSITHRLDREKYPDRYDAVLKEMEERNRRGEVISRAGFDAFLAKSVPLNVGIRVWWCYTWRFVLAQLIIVLPLQLFFMFLAHKFNTDPRALKIVLLVLGLVLNTALGIFIISQALGKRYSDFDIFLRTRGSSQPSPGTYPSKAADGLTGNAQE